MKIALRFLAAAGLLPLGVVLSVTAYAQSDTMGAILEKLMARIKRWRIPAARISRNSAAP